MLLEEIYNSLGVVCLLPVVLHSRDARSLRYLIVDEAESVRNLEIVTKILDESTLEEQTLKPIALRLEEQVGRVSWQFFLVQQPNQPIKIEHPRLLLLPEL